MKIEIELIENAIPDEGGIWNGWLVKQGDKYADGLCFDEMIGLVVALTMPDKRPQLGWMKTAQEHKAFTDRLDKLSKEA